MTTLVTGAAGFVALATIEALLARGDTVVAFDRAPLPEEARAAFARLPGRLVEVAGDVRSAEDLARAFAAAPVRRVLHAAVITAGPAREKADPETIVAVNVLGALSVFRAALAHGAARLVSPSSGAVYGAPPAACTAFGEDETWPRPAALYGITKLATEQMLVRLGAVHGLSVAAPRLAAELGDVLGGRAPHAYARSEVGHGSIVSSGIHVRKEYGTWLFDLQRGRPSPRRPPPLPGSLHLTVQDSRLALGESAA